jgi:hypothetical protein
MSRVKSVIKYQGITVGAESQWIHLDAGNTGTVTISPRDTGSIVILVKIVINTAGSTNAMVVTDTKTGVIANLSASGGTPGQYPYNLPCALGGKLTITNAGGADATVVFVDR